MRRFTISMILGCLLAATPLQADVITIGLRRALADSLYCALAGCTMTGAITAASAGVTFNGANLAAPTANILEQSNGATAQTNRVFNTRTDASNGEWFGLGWTTNVAELFVRANGTGSARALSIGTTGSANVNFYAANSFWYALKTNGLFSAQNAANGVLTAGTMTATNSAEFRTITHRYDWTNAMVVALGAVGTGNITVITLPAKTNVDDVKVVIDTPDSSANALTVSCGVTGAAYIDYVVASDAKAAANTVYGDGTAERGTNMVIVGGHLASYTGTTAFNCQFIKSVTNLNTVTASTGHVLITTRLLP